MKSENIFGYKLRILNICRSIRQKMHQQWVWKKRQNDIPNAACFWKLPYIWICMYYIIYSVNTNDIDNNPDILCNLCYWLNSKYLSQTSHSYLYFCLHRSRRLAWWRTEEKLAIVFTHFLFSKEIYNFYNLYIFFLKADFRAFFLLFTASVRSRKPESTLVPGVFQPIVNNVNLHYLHQKWVEFYGISQQF